MSLYVDNPVTYKAFRALMDKRRRTVDDLVDLFHGKLDENRNFFERVFSQRWRNLETGRYEDRSEVVIPYRSVLDFYFQELAYQQESDQRAAEEAKKRKRGPMSEERRLANTEVLRQARAKQSATR